MSDHSLSEEDIIRRKVKFYVRNNNRRIEQRKCVKFNHLVANCLIFYNVHVINEALQKLNQEGAELGEQVVAALSLCSSAY